MFRPLVPPVAVWAGLCGGVAGVVAAAAGSRAVGRLRLPRQIGDALGGVEQFLLVDDVVAVDDGAALRPRV